MHAPAYSILKKQGFTLLEMSIVLVTIGLLIGGIAGAREIQKAAKLRAFIGQMRTYQTASGLFVQKYNCVPGDCLKASTYNLGANGDGNGLIDISDIYTSHYGFAEMQNFWQHMTNSKLIPAVTTAAPGGVGYVQPALKIGHGQLYVGASNLAPVGTSSRNAFSTVESYGVAVTAQALCGEFYCPSLSPVEASGVDSKMDDGLPMSGKVYAVGGFTYVIQWWSTQGVVGGAAGAASACVVNTGTPYTYNIQIDTTNLCILQFPLLDGD